MNPHACTIVGLARDERPYLLEWVAWYRLLGADRIVVYSNDSTDGSDAMLAALARAGVITHMVWPDRPDCGAQIPAYRDAVARCETPWIGFLDIDEFLVLHRHDTIGGFLADPALAGLDGAIAINQAVFGSSGLIGRDERPVIERFVRRGETALYYNHWCKSIARTAAIAEPGVHVPALASGRLHDPHGRPITVAGDRTQTVDHAVAQVNHYIVKSSREYRHKIARGVSLLPRAQNAAGSARARYSNPFFAAHDRNEVEDRRAADRLPDLRDGIARLRALIAEFGG